MFRCALIALLSVTVAALRVSPGVELAETLAGALSGAKVRLSDSVASGRGLRMSRTSFVHGAYLRAVFCRACRFLPAWRMTSGRRIRTSRCLRSSTT